MEEQIKAGIFFKPSTENHGPTPDKHHNQFEIVTGEIAPGLFERAIDNQDAVGAFHQLGIIHKKHSQSADEMDKKFISLLVKMLTEDKKLNPVQISFLHELERRVEVQDFLPLPMLAVDDVPNVAQPPDDALAADTIGTDPTIYKKTNELAGADESQKTDFDRAEDETIEQIFRNGLKAKTVDDIILLAYKNLIKARDKDLPAYASMRNDFLDFLNEKLADQTFTLNEEERKLLTTIKSEFEH